MNKMIFVYSMSARGLCLAVAGVAFFIAMVSDCCASEREVGASSSQSYYASRMDELKRRAEADPTLQAKIDSTLELARAIVRRPIVERASSLDELKNPDGRRLGTIDGRTGNLEAAVPEKAEIFALAMADTTATGIIIDEMPLVASAYRLTGDKSFLDYVIAQIDELCTWEPLQRPGWTLLKPSSVLPAGGDGVWLATGQGLLALCQTLDVLPPDSLPESTQAAVRALLDREIGFIVKDWADERPWYVRKQAVGSNQWVVPASGLVAASVAAGKDSYPEAYRLGIDSLLKTKNSLGPDGSVSEGIVYAAYWTVPYYAMAAIAARDAGDTRLSDAAFLKNFPLWYVQSFQPGESIINCFDGYGGSRGIYHVFTPRLVRVNALVPNPYMTWLIRNEFADWIQPGFFSLLAWSIPPSEAKEPPLWGSYERARWVVWRSSWTDDASGVWVRGGDVRDGHSHHDRGHVNFILHGKPLLIEAGTPGYDEPLKRESYDSVVGHNVLQVGDEIYPKKAAAPTSVIRLDSDGGEVTVDAGQGYPGVQSWERNIIWTADEISVTDRIVPKKPEHVKLRWHLASEESLSIQSSGGTVTTASLPAGEIGFAGWIGKLPEGSAWTPPDFDVVHTPAAVITVKSDQPVTVSQEKNYDHTMKFRQWRHEHTTLLVDSVEPVEAITIFSQFRRPPVASGSSTTNPMSMFD
ncbi:heparinase II/III domain-containing protein [Puniceicoccus vermicola]|uniref:Heparinase II/III family protein n=1 Tax=Puniceicoccus vermicola TaxID=388746 RepID=A0A7X1AZ64_9BACT|nr:heparinase II/III family protein [Puniceicoccus vermicola]MBC2602663.1 heparinase II/III family protein [Puniceicoccus vermicola]